MSHRTARASKSSLVTRRRRRRARSPACTPAGPTSSTRSVRLLMMFGALHVVTNQQFGSLTRELAGSCFGSVIAYCVLRECVLLELAKDQKGMPFLYRNKRSVCIILSAAIPLHMRISVTHVCLSNSWFTSWISRKKTRLLC